MLTQFLLVNMGFNPVEVEGCVCLCGGGAWGYLPPFIHGPVIPEGEVFERDLPFSSVSLSISVYILPVSLSMFSLHLLHEDYPLFG